MTLQDIPAVDAIGEIVYYADFLENLAVIENRLALFPDGCLVVEDKGVLLGYAVTHPGLIGRPVVLNTVMDALPADADCLFLHDIALSEAARGYGLGKKLISLLKQIACAHGYTHLGLVSVNNSLGFWQAQGFSIHQADETLAAKLATYDNNATYMMLAIT